MTRDDLDPCELRDHLVAAGIPCGALQSVVGTTKRQVLTDGSIVARVSKGATEIRNSPAEEIAWARRICDLVAGQHPLAEPIDIGGYTVTVWQWIDGVPVTPDYARSHGALLRFLHDHGGSPEPGTPLPDQLDSLHARLRQIPDADTRAALSEFAAEATLLMRRADRGEPVLSHGDAHDRNLILAAGVVHILDFDSAGWARRHVDVASGVYAWRHNHQDESAVAEFLAGYGTHRDLDPGLLDGLVWVRRLRGTCTRALNGEEVSARLAELARTQPR